MLAMETKKRKIRKKRRRVPGDDRSRAGVARLRKAHVMGGILGGLCHGLELTEISEFPRWADDNRASRSVELAKIAADACDIYDAVSLEAHKRKIDQ